ncbi:asparagine synthase-related protein, partial [Echinicola sediminis]
MLVSEDISDLIPHLPKTEFDSLGYYTTGGLLNGERTELTPFIGINRVLPGHYLIWEPGKTKKHCYWSFQQFKGKVFQGSFEEAGEELGFLIRQAVSRCHQFAPQAALHLSGGFDSGSIASLICNQSQERRRTYSFAFNEHYSEHRKEEASFIPKYQQHYPQIDPHKIIMDDPLSLEGEFLQHPGNWYGITKKHYAYLITQQADVERKSCIFTGLGGDELASYGHKYQNSTINIPNDFTNHIFQQYHRQMRATKHHIKYWLGKTDKAIIKSNQINSLLTEPRFWYQPSFIRECEP